MGKGPGWGSGSFACEQSDPRTAENAGQEVPGWEIHVHGGFSRTLTGEKFLSEIQNVFVEVSICPETIKLHLESLRETHFEATVTRFEYSSKFSRKSKFMAGLSKR